MQFMSRVGNLVTAAKPNVCAYLLPVARRGSPPFSSSLSVRSSVSTVVDHHNGNGTGYAFHHTSSFILGSPSVGDLEADNCRRDRNHQLSTVSTTIGAPYSTTAINSSNLTYKYPRVLLKISGEALQGKQGFGVDPSVLNHVAEEIAEAHRSGLQLAVVVGGGNYFRGATAPKGMDRAQADYVGMLATVMNALLLQGALENLGIESRVQTAIEMREVAEPYIRRRAIRHLEERRVVIFGAGTGNPFFTTDTAAALRAAEMNANVFMKATKVDGVYDCDPMKNRNAKKYEKLSYRQVCIESLKVMDETAITLCKENDIPVLVFNVMERGNVVRAALGHNVGTVVDGCGAV
ncbi:hypothetical protein Agub_g12212 [Astrephomene gubernaculifera]|uniref:UMP kinase n=1 Tax=Astrephomene gubernaculifera TaxID=47775 RepID=A0AAD3DXY2_9CHLO|nr:hypothetical protein Agub_g12212 [Astrephomene gubernaculifera]